MGASRGWQGSLAPIASFKTVRQKGGAERRHGVRQRDAALISARMASVFDGEGPTRGLWTFGHLDMVVHAFPRFDWTCSTGPGSS